MTEHELETHLAGATEKAIAFAQTFVVNSFPSAVCYMVCCNGRPEEEALLPLQRDEQRFTEIDPDTVRQLITFETGHEVAAFLSRNGKVPVWININVDSIEENATCIVLRYCPRFSAEPDMIRNQSDGTPPFHILGPLLPPGFDSDMPAERQRFDLNWKRKAQP